MKNIFVSMDMSVLEAFKALDDTAEKCLLITDKNKKLLGTITDGDLRRTILNGKKFSEPIKNCCNRDPIVIDYKSYKEELAIKLLTERNLTLIPIINEKKQVLDYVTWPKIKKIGKNRLKGFSLNIPVVIMAGGKGSRLKPFTKVLPKPLVPINEKPIIEHIIDQFVSLGTSKFYISVNYKSKIIKAYFEELNLDYKVSFIEEEKPLGTIGSLHFLNGILKEPCFITNCDILIKSDYAKIYNFHLKGKYDLTLVASAKEYVIPYGTCELNDDGSLLCINEKPKFDFLINTGLYIVNPDLISLIPKNKFYHITDLIKELLKRDKKIGVFPINDNGWIDVGQWAEYNNSLGKL